MIKRILSFVLACLICAAIAVPAFAASTDYLTYFVTVADDDAKSLEKKAVHIYAEYGFPVYYAITDSLGDSADIAGYAEKLFNQKSDGKAGICFAVYIAEGREQPYLYVTEGAKDIFTEEVRENILGCYRDSRTYTDAMYAYYDYISSYLDEQNGTVEKIVEQAAKAVEQKKTEEKNKPQLIVDNTGSLSMIQREKLNEKLLKYGEKSGCRFGIVFSNKLEDGETAQSAAGEYFNKFNSDFGENKNGVVLYVYLSDKEGENEWAVFRSQSVSEFYTDRTTKKLMKPVVRKMTAKDYNGAAELFADNFRGQYGKHGGLSVIWIPLSLLIGFAIAYIALKIKTAGLKSVVSQRTANSYVTEGSFELQSQDDILIRTNVEKSAIVSESESVGSSNRGGGSSGGKVSGGKF